MVFIKFNLLFYTSFFFTSVCIAQPAVIISTKAQYKKLVEANIKNRMVDLKKMIPGLLVDLKYASPNNFTHKILYKKATTTYLRYDAAEALLAVQKSLNKKGFALIIYDAYRPYSVTKLMWDLIKDERYVANPKNGSGHNKGIAVDLSLINISSNGELDMGTSFDNFTELAHHSYTPHLDSGIRANRYLLQNTLESFGFKSLETEWWHYSWNSPEEYDIIDISFKKIKALTIN